MYSLRLIISACPVKDDLKFRWDCSVSDDGRTKPVPRKGHSESFEPADNKCLIRASDGKKKISTVVGGACVELINRSFGWLMLKCRLFLFQVSTKEVIKFQMVSWLLLFGL